MGVQASELDRQAGAYDHSFPYFEENRIVHEAYGRRVAQHIARHRSEKVLSLGIGHTEVARQIIAQLANDRFQRYVVVDGSPKIIASFRSALSPNPEGLELVEGFFETFDYPAVFDVIEAGFVLEHVEDPKLVLSRMRRFLSPRGRLFVAVPNATSLHRLIGHHAGLINDMYALSDADRALGHRRYFDVEKLTALLVACDYKVESVEGMLLKPFTTAQITRLNLSPAVWEAMQAVAKDHPSLANAICVEATLRL